MDWNKGAYKIMNTNLLISGEIKLQPADLIFSRGNSGFGKAIRWFTRGKYEGMTKVNHVLGVTEVIKNSKYLITEALARVVERDFFDAYINNDQEFIIFRNKNLDNLHKIYVAYEVKDNVGKLYSPLRIVGQAIDGIINKFRKKEIKLFSYAPVPFTVICSVLWSNAFKKVGVSFGVGANSTDPDQMCDYCIDHSDEWEIIFVTDKF